MTFAPEGVDLNVFIKKLDDAIPLTGLQFEVVYPHFIPNDDP
jgi:hypothetical protein